MTSDCALLHFITFYFEARRLASSPRKAFAVPTKVVHTRKFSRFVYEWIRTADKDATFRPPAVPLYSRHRFVENFSEFRASAFNLESVQLFFALQRRDECTRYQSDS